MNNSISLYAFQQLQKNYAKSQEYVGIYRHQIVSLKTEVAILTEKVRMLQEHANHLTKMLFAPKSEKTTNKSPDVSQGSLLDYFDELPECQQEMNTKQEEEAEAETETITFTRKKRRKKGNEESSPVIDRSLVTLVDHPSEDPTEIGEISDHTCACGANMVKTGEKTVTKIEFVPAHFEEHVYHESIYTCPNCSGDPEHCGPILPAALNNQLLPEALPTNNLLAQLVYNKYCCSLPLYRQNDIFVDLGVELSRASMSRWLLDGSELCMPLCDCLLNQIQLGEILNMDETRLQVLREEARANTTNSHLWYMCGGRDGPCRYFYYSISRSGAVATYLIGPFHGYLQTDGYAGYNAVGNQPGIIHVGCLDHIRRRFVATVNACAQTMPLSVSIAQQILNEIRKVYLVERTLRDQNLPADIFLTNRAEMVQPILSTIESYIDKYLPTTPRSSLLGKALSYAHGQWKFLCNYLLHPGLGPSNQLAENGIRPVAVGRKNYLFAGDPRGAKALACYYSLIETAKANNIRPLTYLTFVFDHIRSTPGDRMSVLLPWNCDLAR